MNRRIRLLLVTQLTFCALVLGAGVAFADDCGSPSDCQTAPGNIEGALGVVGLGAGVAMLNNALNGGGGGGGAGPASGGDGSFLDDVAGAPGAVEEGAAVAADGEGGDAAEAGDGAEDGEGGDAAGAGDGAEDGEGGDGAEAEDGAEDGAADEEQPRIPRFRDAPLGEGGGE